MRGTQAVCVDLQKNIEGGALCILSYVAVSGEVHSIVPSSLRNTCGLALSRNDLSCKRHEHSLICLEACVHGLDVYHPMERALFEHASNVRMKPSLRARSPIQQGL